MSDGWWRLGDRLVNKFDLYELCVQTPAMQARFLEAVHNGGGVGGAGGLTLGEDFAGPAGIARAWVALSEGHRAVCTDRDPEPLEHAARRAEEMLGRGTSGRLAFVADDVLVARRGMDVIAALNFAVCELTQRAALLTYLRHALCRLETGGVLVADLYGGSDAFATGMSEQVIETAAGPVTYAWEQRAADPLTGRVVNAMHFGLPGGERVPDAFVYHWRLWGVAELRDAMREAGFASTQVYGSLGGAIDEEGRLYALPDADDAEGVSDPAALDDPYVVYIAGRV